MNDTPPPYLMYIDRGPGRPRVPDDERLHVFTVRLTAAEHAKLKQLGGRKWVQRQLARVTRLKLPEPS